MIITAIYERKDGFEIHSQGGGILDAACVMNGQAQNWPEETPAAVVCYGKGEGVTFDESLRLTVALLDNVRGHIADEFEERGLQLQRSAECAGKATMPGFGSGDAPANVVPIEK